MDINLAHGIMLTRCGIVKKTHGARILGALEQIRREGKTLFRSYRYRGDEEDLFFYVEKRLEKICGPEISGHLSVARSRNDVDITLYRMVLRKELIQTARQSVGLRQLLLELAGRHVKTIFPVITHTQLAQPTTLAHYLLAAVEFLERDFVRITNAYSFVNQSPLGACVATTTGFPIDRALLADLLGFEAVLENAYGCIASVDYLVESVSTVSTLMINLGRFIQDLLLWSSQNTRLIHLADGFVQGSSIMPQKRNPVALEHLRVLASNAVGQCQAVTLSLHNTPFGDIVDAEDDIQPVVRSAFEYTSRVLELLTQVLKSVTIDVDRALSICQSGEITLTELADWLVRNHQLPFRTAHRIVSEAAGHLSRQPARRRGESMAQAVSLLTENSSRRILGRTIRVSPEQMVTILDPVHFVQVRRVIGGPAPRVVERSIASQTKKVQRQKEWLTRKEEALKSYAKKLRPGNFK